MIPDYYGEYQSRFYSQGEEKRPTRAELHPIYCNISAWIKNPAVQAAVDLPR